MKQGTYAQSEHKYEYKTVYGRFSKEMRLVQDPTPWGRHYPVGTIHPCDPVTLCHLTPVDAIS